MPLEVWIGVVVGIRVSDSATKAVNCPSNDRPLPQYICCRTSQPIPKQCPSSGVLLSFVRSIIAIPRQFGICSGQDCVSVVSSSVRVCSKPLPLLDTLATSASMSPAPLSGISIKSLLLFVLNFSFLFINRCTAGPSDPPEHGSPRVDCA